MIKELLEWSHPRVIPAPQDACDNFVTRGLLAQNPRIAPGQKTSGVGGIADIWGKTNSEWQRVEPCCFAMHRANYEKGFFNVGVAVDRFGAPGKGSDCMITRPVRRA